ncbi:MAG: zinc ribbon domain-containing protein [Thermoplasmata archaeon]|nr:zinc ribbon domain-containing protein [Thermoplasmata archaeon]
MRLLRLVPIVVGLALVLLGIYLVGSQGNIAGINIPSALGLPNCSSSSNSTQCLGVGGYGSIGVGTIVVMSGIGILATSLRSGMAAAAMGGTATMGGMPPELLASLQTAQARMVAMSPASAPAAAAGTHDPAFKFCQKCGTRTETESKFCRSCGTPF